MLTLEYDRPTHSEIILDKDSNEVLRVYYNTAGQPVNFVPHVASIQSLNITYNSRGQMTQWTFGDQVVSFVYDERTGYMTEKQFGNRANYRYIYRSGTKVCIFETTLQHFICNYYFLLIIFFK